MAIKMTPKGLVVGLIVDQPRPTPPPQPTKPVDPPKQSTKASETDAVDILRQAALRSRGGNK